MYICPDDSEEFWEEHQPSEIHATLSVYSFTRSSPISLRSHLTVATNSQAKT